MSPSNGAAAGIPLLPNNKMLLENAVSLAEKLGVSIFFWAEFPTLPSSELFDGYLDPFEAAELLYAAVSNHPDIPTAPLMLALSLRDKNGLPSSAECTESFIAGLDSKISELSAFLFPLTETYSRFGEFGAPKYITWSEKDTSQLIYSPKKRGDITLNLAAPAADPFTALALLIEAGLDGITRRLPLPAPLNGSFADVKEEELKFFRSFSPNLDHALYAARFSGFIRKLVGSEALDAYILEMGLPAPDPKAPNHFTKKYFSVP
ncbi:MAG: hypothetical protein IJF27_00410 [Oscillospiraceae bacterium]|nr:hypothetical protein [Oscillospiraceae bacterium]MBQ3049099.1 hypothetical protein [Oscillospiraceae bacterium]